MQLYAITAASVIDIDRMMSETETFEYVEFQVVAVASRLESLIVQADFSKFHPIDATPAPFLELQRQRIEDFNIFRRVDKVSEVLINKADLSVIEHLEAIKRLQAPEQKRLRQLEGTEPRELPKTKPFLQLVSVA